MVEEKKESEIILRDERGANIIEVNPEGISRNLVAMITKTDIMTLEDKKFFLDNTERWQMVQKNCHIWRTDVEKKSIIKEYFTTHQQFHQAILENKVFIDETVRLAKDAEIQKLDAEELYVDIENLKETISGLNIDRQQYLEEDKEYKNITYDIRKKDIELRKKTVELQEKAYQIQQSAIAMGYRMSENRSWKVFQDEMLEDMKSQGYTEEQIWDKNFGQKEGYFFLFLTKYAGVKQSKDTGEIFNLTHLAKFTVDEAIEDNTFEDYLKRCNSIQLQSLVELGYIGVKEENGSFQVLIPEQYRKKPQE